VRCATGKERSWVDWIAVSVWEFPPSSRLVEESDPGLKNADILLFRVRVLGSNAKTNHFQLLLRPPILGALVGRQLLERLA